MAAKQELVAEFIQLDVSDWQTMATFYQEVLGFEPIVLEPDDHYGWLQSGPIKLALRGCATPREGQGSRFSLLFRVENVEQGIANLERAGCQFYDTQLAPAGHSYQVAYFSDPEGNALAIFSEPDS
jgi:predicted enzyme related to lactoylglutathione lyase